ncbi:hypothetical protein ISN45_Aa08g008630 [Arabidopsis thaliana x Arabidopsis arenosa]|uniref:Uncharacterized protein n=1 Tax=Arabidopsis thaliana x Arabidopsis arenosa TaxID=1240361 RepID=A0A8T1XLP8_9BRAS|nr:hypothetical protein ISN45_Aa08g008630 [Arabidopsis thaliana x Arabidopsis arenosa]
MSSSIGSFGSISDHRQTRTSDDSNVRSVNQFLNESVSDSHGRRSGASSSSSASSVARTSPVIAELQAVNLSAGQELYTYSQSWTALPDYLCIYEKHITDCGLTFPIPAFLLQYALRRQMAFVQLSPAAIRNAYGLIRLAEQCSVEPRCSLYEELIVQKKFGKSKPGLVYTQSSINPKLVVGAKSKTNDWLRWYFFVKVDRESAGDVVVTNYHGWKVSPVRCPKIFDPYPEKLHDDVHKILALCPYTWPDEEDPVRRPSSKPKGTRRKRARNRRKLAGPQLCLVDEAAYVPSDRRDQAARCWCRVLHQWSETTQRLPRKQKGGPQGIRPMGSSSRAKWSCREVENRIEDQGWSISGFMGLKAKPKKDGINSNSNSNVEH